MFIFQENEQEDSDSKPIENIDVIIDDSRDSDYIGDKHYRKYRKKKDSNYDNSSKTVKSKLSKRKSSSNDITLSNAVVTLAESLSKSITNYNNTDEQDEWSTLGTLVAKKIRKLKNPLLKLKAENEIQNILWQISVEDAGCSVTYVPNPSSSPNSNNIPECH